MKRWFWTAAVCSLIILVAAACGSRDERPPTRTSTPAPVPTVEPPAISFEELQQLERHYSALRNAHNALSMIWEGLASGQQIQCSELPVFPAPEAIASGDDSSEPSAGSTLRSAAIELDQASRLWRAECANPRATIPADIIDRGRMATRAAGDALQQAHALLTAP